jgi:hypothetical protein
MAYIYALTFLSLFANASIFLLQPLIELTFTSGLGPLSAIATDDALHPGPACV